ncbi:MAG: biosynthetic arginine decarboxylase [Polyangiaceae bacterium]|nr:biosynthetic arginine decarboxylase [Polyangiaceae bacterium]
MPTDPAPTGRPPEPVSLPDDVVEWTADSSEELYQVSGWGAPYFSVNDAGRVEVRANPNGDSRIDLFELTEDLRARGLQLPLLIHFSDILAHRIRRINESFLRAIQECEYDGDYRGVYPVKVNQQRHIVEEVVRFGAPWGFGLEVGSKPELLIALASMRDSAGLIICNGYKDRSYIETALVAQRLGRTVVIVLERMEEFELVYAGSQRLDIKPMLGVRAKLTSKGMGRWAESAGDRAKFGLTTAELVQLVDKLEARDLRSCLRLLHFHIGSQISSIIPIKNALQEATQIYVELVEMGCAMGYLDVGGGLAIDYDGSKTDFHASRNYTLGEYAVDVVSTIQAACLKAELSMPTIVSESGRAVVAHQSVLVFDVVGTQRVQYRAAAKPDEGAHPVLHQLFETYEGISPKNVQEFWHDACQAKSESESLFRFGYLTLRERAHAERLYYHCCCRIHEAVKMLKFVPEELQEVEKRMGSIYYCNFSVFQSAPDTWAIDQLFPLMPIHRLDEQPTVDATLADLTCDSDGVIDKFIDVEDVKRTLKVHPVTDDEPYYLGMFLNGAYQEILGDLHNLFGDTNAVHISTADYGYRVNHVIKGDSMSEVLRYVAHDPERMIESVREQAEDAYSKGRMSLDEMRRLMENYESALEAYTYLAPASEPDSER